MPRRCFYSFHYQPDNWRAAKVRNIGKIEGNQPAADNDWETISGKGDQAIKNWIDAQMHGRSCTVVLVGTNTAGRKWINHEIVQSWNAGMGVVAIHINGIKDKDGLTSARGANPLDSIKIGGTDKKLSSVAKCYSPGGSTSAERYSWISQHIENAVAEAVAIRKKS